MAASIRMQGPGAFVFSFFDYKLLLMPIITMYVNLFSFSTNKVWSFGVAAYSTAPRERVWRATIKVPGFKFKVHKNEFVSARFSKTCQQSLWPPAGGAGDEDCRASRCQHLCVSWVGILCSPELSLFTGARHEGRDSGTVQAERNIEMPRE